MFLTEEVKKVIKDDSIGRAPKEACGLIVFDGAKLLALPSVNCADEQFHNFQIHENDYLRAAFTGKIVAFYHSHTSEITEFSEKDLANARGHGLCAIMYNVRNDSFSEENGVRNPSYIGRTFKIGERDCYSIIRDYYKKELKIELGDYFRDENWARKTPELYEQNYERENFIKVKTGSPVLEELKQHDCILFQFLDIPFPSHAAVYLGGGSILHHPRNGYSLIEKLSDPYLRRASYVLRHKSLWKS